MSATAASTSDHFQYIPLDWESWEIRLIRLPLFSEHEGDTQNADPGSEPVLQCELIHVHLDSDAPPAYRALSYTWGDIASGTRKICIHGKSWVLRANLYDALRQFQRSFRGSLNSRGEADEDHLLLWVDALCIDQKNDEERSSQVSKMRIICARAKQVLVWLGLESSTSGRAIVSVEEAIARVTDNQSCSSRRRATEIGDNLLHMLKTRKCTVDVDGLAELFGRPYWRRIWTVQELTAAREVLVWCGQALIELHKLSAVQHALQGGDEHFNHDIWTAWIWTPIIFIYGNVQDLQRFYATKDRLCGGGPFCAEQARMYLADVLFDKRSSMSDLTNIVREHEASDPRESDPRDMVYALASSINALRSQYLVIDYSKSIREVYTDFMIYVVGQDKTLNTWSSLTGKPSKLTGLPSWVVDWSAFHSDHVYLDLQTWGGHRPTAAGDTEVDSKFSQYQMTVRGLRIGNIDNISSKPVNSMNDGYEMFVPEYLSWFSLLRHIADTKDEQMIVLGHAFATNIASMATEPEDTRIRLYQQIAHSLFAFCLKHVHSTAPHGDAQAPVVEEQPNFEKNFLPTIRHYMWDRRFATTAKLRRLANVPARGGERRHPMYRVWLQNTHGVSTTRRRLPSCDRTLLG